MTIDGAKFIMIVTESFLLLIFQRRSTNTSLKAHSHQRRYNRLSATSTRLRFLIVKGILLSFAVGSIFIVIG